MRRHAIGLLALVLLLLAAGLQFFQFEDPNAADLQSACLRIGAVMAAIWLASQHLQRVPGWLWFTLPVLLFALARRPQWLLFLIPLVIALAILRPRRLQRP